MADILCGYDADGNTFAGGYTTIASAVSAASADDRVVVYYANTTQGLYYIENPAITKKISIVSGLKDVRPTMIGLTYAAVVDTDQTIEGFYFYNYIDRIEVDLSAGSSANVTVKNCVSTVRGFAAQSVDGTAEVHFQNCISHGARFDGFRAESTAVGKTYAQNCLCIAGNRGFRDVISINCVSVGNVGGDFLSPETGTDYCVSSDGTEIGANSSQVKFESCGFLDFKDGGPFYRIGLGSTLLNLGTATGLPTNDIDGQAYTTNAIGPYSGVIIETDADNILSTAGGNWQQADSTLYLAPNQYGVNGTSETGTFSADAPTAPTLAVVDNGDGTATATVTGADASSTNKVYSFQDEMTVSPSLVASISENGSGTFTVSPIGLYWFYVVSDVSGVTSFGTNIVRVDVTDGDEEATGAEDQYIRQNGELFTIQTMQSSVDSNYARTNTWADSHQAYGWIQPIGSDLLTFYERRNLQVDSKVFFATDPQATEGDRIRRLDGRSYVIRGVIEQAGQNRLWRVDIEQIEGNFNDSAFSSSSSSSSSSDSSSSSSSSSSSGV